MELGGKGGVKKNLLEVFQGVDRFWRSDVGLCSCGDLWLRKAVGRISFPKEPLSDEAEAKLQHWDRGLGGARNADRIWWYCMWSHWARRVRVFGSDPTLARILLGSFCSSSLPAPLLLLVGLRPLLPRATGRFPTGGPSMNQVMCLIAPVENGGVRRR